MQSITSMINPTFIWKSVNLRYQSEKSYCLTKCKKKCEKYSRKANIRLNSDFIARRLKCDFILYIQGVFTVIGNTSIMLGLMPFVRVLFGGTIVGPVLSTAR